MNFFSIEKQELRYVIKIFNYKIKIVRIHSLVRNFIELIQRQEKIEESFLNLYFKINYLENKKQFNPKELFDKKIRPYNNCYLDVNISYINYLFPNLEGTFDNKEELEKNPNFFYLCGLSEHKDSVDTVDLAMKLNLPVYIFEDCFLRSIFSHVYQNKVESKYHKSIGFSIDDITAHYNSQMPSRLELMLNDKNLVITEEQKQRARKCIDKIIATNLSKYNNQPIYTPSIGKNRQKVLVIDQSFGDYSIIKGGASQDTFNLMLERAIVENPNADIIIKTHPDTLSGNRDCYYSTIKEHDNIYRLTEAINPISLIKYVDKVYVCTSLFGFEALMCNKEVHVFGIPFYQGWGLTIDEQKCERRTNKRTLEEVFYIAYIMYSYYVNPDKKCRCEIEDAIDYLLKLREEYFSTLK